MGASRASTPRVLGLVLGLAVGGPTLVSCNRSSDFADCTAPVDPTVGTGTRLDKCPHSTFEPGTAPWRDLSGVAWRGENGVPGAVVSIATLRTGETYSAITGPNGFFGPIKDVAVQYDMTLRMDADVLALRGLVTRFPNPSIDTDVRKLAGAWSKPLDVHFDTPIPPDHEVAFFASGGTTFGVTGDLEHGAALVDKEYAGTATIHAIEYQKGKDLSTAMAYGKVDLFATAGSPQLVRFKLDPITKFGETTFTASLPAGFTADPVDIIVNYTRTSGTRLTTVPLGQKSRFPVLPNAGGYEYRVRARGKDGSITATGETFLDVFAPETKAELFDVPTLDMPADGASVAASTRLSAHGAGVLEHVLVPQSGTGSIHVITAAGEAPLPDFGAVGASIPSGKYTWVVRSFPKLAFVELVGGQDARRYDPVATSAPRTIVFGAAPALTE